MQENEIKTITMTISKINATIEAIKTAKLFGALIFLKITEDFFKKKITIFLRKISTKKIIAKSLSNFKSDGST